MSLDTLLQNFSKSPLIKELRQHLLNSLQGNSIHIRTLSGSMKCVLPAVLHRSGIVQGRMMIVAESRSEAKEWLYDLGSLIGTEHLLLITEPDKHVRISSEQLDERIVSIIDALAALTNDPQAIVILTPDALSFKVPPPLEVGRHRLEISRGQKVPFQEFTTMLMLQGFERKEMVENPGDIAIRGGIVDIFPLGFDAPLRIEFWGDDIESMREFDPSSQRSIRELEHIAFVAHLFHQDQDDFSGGILAYLPADSTTVVLDQPELLSIALEKLELPPFDDALATYTKLLINAMGKPDLAVESVLQPNFSASVAEFCENLRKMSTQNIRFYLCAEGHTNLRRLQELVHSGMERAEEEEHEDRPGLAAPADALRRIRWCDAALSRGFIYPAAGIALLTEHQLFERQHFQSARKKKKFTGITLRELAQLHRGDFVVHVDKGIGKFDGLETIEINGAKQECARLIYDGGDILFVHLNHLHKIQKYSAAEDGAPRLSKLGSSEWDRKKQRTKKRLKDIARELIRLYAKRKSEPGYAFPEDSIWQKEFEASFLYEDTPDQARSTAEVKKDMESTTPMDRLVCGDVGFGKTEIAIRAAFKAVQAGKQVAVLVPTTILAHQHFNTFSDRLRRYPVNIDVISRFRSTAEQKEISNKLSQGGIDILIGTHRILSKDMEFRNLGLLIIDEEQRFGVAAKEKLRHMRVSVDTLTLTATPIPRTLNFSLMGARDLSVIETPPRNRLPIITEIIEWDLEKIKENILRELERGGQMFFVSDKISELDRLMLKLKEIVPSLRCGIAHGQMESNALEVIMEKFLERKIDCLISTKLVESGLDIPNANTIFVHNADNFGLAELYQLRGRVGRSNTQAYCALIIPPVKKLTPTAVKRLQALEEYTDLGSGFQLALRDMEIRGAGNLLGAEQSGFIADMGFELYQQIVQEAVSELREEEFTELFRDSAPVKRKKVKANQEISVDISADSLLPQDYIRNDTERFEYYKKLYNVRSEAEVQNITSELRDRYGKPPEQAMNLIYAVRLRCAAMEMGFHRIALRNSIMSIELPPETNAGFYELVFPFLMQFIPDMPGTKVSASGKRVIIQATVKNQEHAIEYLQQLKYMLENASESTV